MIKLTKSITKLRTMILCYQIRIDFSPLFFENGYDVIAYFMLDLIEICTMLSCQGTYTSDRKMAWLKCWRRCYDVETCYGPSQPFSKYAKFRNCY